MAEGPRFEPNIHKKYLPRGVKALGIDIYDGTASVVKSRFINVTGATYRIGTFGSDVGRLYGVGTSNFLIVGKDGIVKYLARRYDEPALQQNLDNLTSGVSEDPPSVLRLFNLEQNYPNPFNPNTRIDFELGVNEPVAVELAIFNVMGQKVKILVDRELRSGFYHAFWDGRIDSGELAPSGIYLYTLTTAGLSETRRMLFIR